ncbi:MAG: hypothetical protein RBR77_07580 [Thauera sp.]|jgi:hypothetical protein|nr:hypothetical protein [Thauera sp.]
MSDYKRYTQEIERYERKFGQWERRAEKIVDRYRDERPERSTSAKMNILWSNVQTAMPAVFSRLPKPEVTRRNKDRDAVGRVASQILERALSYEIEHYADYASAMSNAVEDRFLPGRGTVWVRYEPHFTESPQLSEDTLDEGVAEEIEYECSPCDYVAWQDFGHAVVRTWEEQWLVWRRVYMDREQLRERFGEDADQIPLDVKEDKQSKGEKSDCVPQACIYEMWDKRAKKAVWLSKNYDKIIDERDDPLKLQDFFPCPKPLYATTTTGSLVPVPDFSLYQDQAKELDIITGRIDKLVRALRVAGVYAAENAELKSLIGDSADNRMIPVNNWAMFAEKGGIKGAVDWFPVEMVVSVLQGLYVARDQCKQTIYEITGISDIVRGASDAGETATAQQIKSRFASIRLQKMQAEVARFAADLIRIKAEIMCELYQPQTLLMYADAQNIPEVQKLQDPMQQQEFLSAALQLLRDQYTRGFRISISSDALVEIDEQQEKQDRIEFLGAAGSYVKQAAEAAQAAPQMAPLMVSLLLFGVRAFKAGAEVESEFEELADQIRQQPAPDPRMQQMQQELQQQQQMLSEQAQQMEQEKQSLFQERTSFEVERVKAGAELAQRDADLTVKGIDLQYREQRLLDQSREVVE